MRWAAAALALFLAVVAEAEAAPYIDSDSLLREHLWQQVRDLPAGERPKVGLVLSAGAVRGLAHIGVIHVLEDAGFPIDVVVGTSMGAVVGALYAGGAGAGRLWEIGTSIRLNTGSDLGKFRLFQLLINDSLLSTKNMEAFLQASIGDKRFDQIPKPFACVAMDLRTGEKVVFRDGPLAPAVRASASVPGVFEPVQYRHRYLVDGGVIDYIPVDAAKLLGAEWILASVTEGDFSKSLPTNVLLSLMQVIDIRGAMLSRQQRREADVLIEPDVGDIRSYDVDRIREAIEKGMEAAKRGIPEAKESLIIFSLPRLWKRWTRLER
ncbi:MAG: patatin-like phospholipase family protein [Elusimicrobiota bacterium]